MSLNVVILAAGQGKRMHSDKPKVLHTLAGRPLLSHVIECARALDATRICVVYGHGGNQVRDAVSGPDLAFVLQAPQLGTGHAVGMALPALCDAPVTLVLYGDVPLVRPSTLKELIGAARDGMAVLTAELDDPTGYGRIIRSAGGEVQGIVEEADASPEQRSVREVNTGIMALPTPRLAGWLQRLTNDNAQREYYLTDVVKLALAAGICVTAVRTSDASQTLGVNNRSHLAQLERIYQREYAERLLHQGVALADPARIDVRGALTCGRDVEIDVNCVFEGAVTVGDRVAIGPNCVLKNVSIGAGTHIAAFTHMEDASVGERCRIGPFARLRPGARLSEDVHIGNFVEVKASDFGAGSKANHLAYVGDSSVGRNVNVGAGTITCNYDGANKHRTVIEDDVFIGSDTQLVAPVTVRKGATIGAGATITRDVPAGVLAYSRRTHTIVEGWQRPRKKRES
jgi:bifunctional UDP-N-acetylglucosamine pyrophosphorylase / glucosamine-1-phosphate N-acetyltransferase